MKKRNIATTIGAALLLASVSYLYAACGTVGECYIQQNYGLYTCEGSMPTVTGESGMFYPMGPCGTLYITTPYTNKNLGTPCGNAAFDICM